MQSASERPRVRLRNEPVGQGLETAVGVLSGHT
jgi:hypothetical protein